MSFDTLERTSDLEIDGASQGDLSEAALGDETETESVGGASVASRVASPTPPPQHLHAPHVHSSGDGEREGGGGGAAGRTPPPHRHISAGPLVHASPPPHRHHVAGFFFLKLKKHSSL